MTPTAQTGLALICVRAPSSHRGYDYAQGALGFKPQSYYGWHVRGYYWFLIDSDLAKIRKYGATRTRVKPEQLARCWHSDERFAPTQPYKTP